MGNGSWRGGGGSAVGRGTRGWSREEAEKRWRGEEEVCESELHKG